MTLIIEEGAGDNLLANSYRSVEDLRLYAQLRGIDLGNKTDAECETLLISAMDYLEAQRDRFKGYKTSESQPLQWPRSEVWDVEQRNSRLPSNEIPRLVEYAQLALAIEAIGSDLMPNRSTDQRGPVLKEKVGSIEVTYSADTPKQAFVEALAKPAALLSPLYKRNGLTMVRG
tara:strand:- start:10601 stop:11119 length:519 start_codon:yes stop_codon:yes gene_type:complete